MATGVTIRNSQWQHDDTQHDSHVDIPIVTAIATTSEAPDMVLSASRGMYQRCYCSFATYH